MSGLNAPRRSRARWRKARGATALHRLDDTQLIAACLDALPADPGGWREIRTLEAERGDGRWLCQLGVSSRSGLTAIAVTLDGDGRERRRTTVAASHTEIDQVLASVQVELGARIPELQGLGRARLCDWIAERVLPSAA